MRTAAAAVARVENAEDEKMKKKIESKLKYVQTNVLSDRISLMLAQQHERFSCNLLDH